MIAARHGAQPLEDVIRDIKKFTSLKIIEAINGNQQESRRELLMWLFERSVTRNPTNTRYQFWQQHSHPIELNTNEKPCLALADVSRFSGRVPL
jgi:putative transposase